MTSRRKRKIKEALSGYLFIMPNFIGFLIFTSLPVVASLLLSFTNWDIFNIENTRFIGLHNFFQILGFHIHHEQFSHWISYLYIWKYFEPNDERFWQYLWNTIFLMIGIPLNLFGSLALALVMNQKIRGIVIFRTIYFIPTISSGIALFMLWRWLLNPDFRGQQHRRR